tara:strand:- start:75 stop:1193 length:1119 start_codon:yes stop_codon:yes gene_type:complete
MFRGGRVSSYGTGIAAPLVPGYKEGGQIGGGIIYGKPMGDRFGFAEPKSYSETLKEQRRLAELLKDGFRTEEDIRKEYESRLRGLEPDLLLGVDEFGPGTFGDLEQPTSELYEAANTSEAESAYIAEELAKEKLLIDEARELGAVTDQLPPKTAKEIKIEQDKIIELDKLKILNNQEQDTSSQFENYFKEYLPVIQEQLKPDSDSSKRAKFLELAKAGLSILSQPGGQTLGEVVGKATAPSITNLQNLMAQDEQAAQAPKLLALQAAMKRMEGPSATELGIKGKRIQIVAEDFVNKGLSADAGYKAANTLDQLRQKGSDLSGKFKTELPKNKEDYPKKGTGKHYYYTPEGDLKVYDSDTREEFDISELVELN